MTNLHLQVASRRKALQEVIDEEVASPGKRPESIRGRPSDLVRQISIVETFISDEELPGVLKALSWEDPSVSGKFDRGETLAAGDMRHCRGGSAHPLFLLHTLRMLFHDEVAAPYRAGYCYGLQAHGA